MAELQGQEGELRFTVQITRAATGQVEEHELVGKISDTQLEQLKELNNVSNPHDSGA